MENVTIMPGGEFKIFSLFDSESMADVTKLVDLEPAVSVDYFGGDNEGAPSVSMAVNQEVNAAPFSKEHFLKSNVDVKKSQLADSSFKSGILLEKIFSRPRAAEAFDWAQKLINGIEGFFYEKVLYNLKSAMYNGIYESHATFNSVHMAAQAAEKINDANLTAKVYYLAGVTLLKHDKIKGGEALKKSESFAKTSGNMELLAMINFERAQFGISENKINDLDLVVDMAKQAGSMTLAANASYQSAILEMKDGKTNDAIEKFSKAAKFALASGDSLLRAEACYQKAMLLLTGGENKTNVLPHLKNVAMVARKYGGMKSNVFFRLGEIFSFLNAQGFAIKMFEKTFKESMGKFEGTLDVTISVVGGPGILEIQVDNWEARISKAINNTKVMEEVVAKLAWNMGYPPSDVLTSLLTKTGKPFDFVSRRVGVEKLKSFKASLYKLKMMGLKK